MLGDYGGCSSWLSGQQGAGQQQRLVTAVFVHASHIGPGCAANEHMPGIHKQQHQPYTAQQLSTHTATGAPAGFDPLRLGASDTEQLKWYREGELYNGRWAMAAVAGILFTDLVGLPKFWEAGAEVRAAAGVC